MSQGHFGEKGVVILLRYLRECRGGGSKLSNIRTFIILLLGKGLTSFNKNNCANVSVKKNDNEALWGVSFLSRRQKALSEISTLWSFSSMNLKVSHYYRDILMNPSVPKAKCMQ